MDDAGASGAAAAGTCVEHVPPGARRPIMKEELTPRGLSGYAVELQVVITHGKGETVLPDGFHLQGGSDAAKALEKAGFVIPDADGGAAPRITVSPGAPGEGGTAVTTLTIPVVPLPPKPGRHVLDLPPLPIAIARANNEFVTVCTAPHPISIEDPIANELDPQVKPNPPGRPQREDWPLARNLAMGIPAGARWWLLGALLHRWWSQAAQARAVAPPRIPPWITALSELDAIRRSDLLEEGKLGEHFDQVSFALRRYLGARYGFDALGPGESGLETTTREMLDLLQRVRPPIVELPRIQEFLDDCDLVKFARFTPTEDLCRDALARGERIVRRTIPVMQLPSAPPASTRLHAARRGRRRRRERAAAHRRRRRGDARRAGARPRLPAGRPRRRVVRGELAAPLAAPRGSWRGAGRLVVGHLRAGPAHTAPAHRLGGAAAPGPARPAHLPPRSARRRPRLGAGAAHPRHGSARLGAARSEPR